jgi:hypothetical protein
MAPDGKWNRNVPAVLNVAEGLLQQRPHVVIGQGIHTPFPNPLHADEGLTAVRSRTA